MRTFKKILGITALAILLTAFAPRAVKAQDISSQDFYDSLSDYGTWVSDPQYGDVWVPDAGDDFMPYRTRGHWVLTDYGNTWVSDYPWGWATFHYGRWHYDDYYGWEWVPGYEWAPAWVSWREGGGYYGWAPLMPGIGINVSFGSGYRVPDNYWVCVPQRYINSPSVNRYYAQPTTVVNIINRTTIINNTYANGGHRYIAGPRAEDIQRITHRPPRIYQISNAGSPGAINVHNTTVNIYRPAIKKAPDAHPARVVDGAAYRTQNPDAGIVHKEAQGGAAFNHDNAVKLATIAKSSTPDNKVVHVNRPGNPPAQAAGQPQPAASQQAAAPPAQQPQDNRRSGRAGNNRQQAAPPAQAQQQVTPPAQQAAPPAQQPQQQNNGGSGRRGNRQQANPPAQAAPQQAAPPAQAPQQVAPPAQQQQDNRQQGRRGGQNPPAATQPQPDNNAQQQAQQQQAQQRQAQQAQQQRQQAVQQAQQQAAHQQQQQQRQQQQPPPAPRQQPPQQQQHQAPPPRQVPPPQQKPPEEHHP